MIWKSSLVTLAMTMVVWMLVLSTTTAEATEDETLSKKQLTEMLGQYKPAFKTVIKRMTQYLDRKRAKNGLERRGEEVTADDMKRGIQSTFGAAWVKDNVKSIKKVMSAKINEHHKELRKRSQEGSLSEKEKAQIAKDASKAVEKKLRDEFKTTGKEQLQLFVDLANEQQKPKGAVFNKRSYTAYDEYNSLIFDDDSGDPKGENDSEFEKHLASRDMTDKDGDGIDDYFFDSLFSDPEPTLPKPSGRKSATPIVVPSVSAPSQKRDSFVPVNKRALAEYTPKDLAMWNIIFGLLTAVLLGPLFVSSIGGTIATLAFTMLVLAPVTSKILFDKWF